MMMTYIHGKTGILTKKSRINTVLLNCVPLYEQNRVSDIKNQYDHCQNCRSCVELSSATIFISA